MVNILKGYLKAPGASTELKEERKKRFPGTSLCLGAILQRNKRHCRCLCWTQKLIPQTSKVRPYEFLILEEHLSRVIIILKMSSVIGSAYGVGAQLGWHPTGWSC